MPSPIAPGRGGSRQRPAPGARWASPLHVLAGPLHRLSGSHRFYNLLEQNGFASVEEVAVTWEDCWFELRNCEMVSSPRNGSSSPSCTHVTRRPERAACPAWQCGAGCERTGHAIWVARSRGQGTAGNGRLGYRRARSTDPGGLLTLAPDVEDLPPDVARGWDRIRQLGPRPLVGAALPNGDLPGWPGTGSMS